MSNGVIYNGNSYIQKKMQNNANQKQLTEHVRKINSEVEIVPVVMDVTMQEIEELTKEVDLIIDATDNFDTRLLINDISQKENIPWIYGGCVGGYGVTYTSLPGKTPCFRR